MRTESEGPATLPGEVPPERVSSVFPWQIEDCQIVTIPIAETHLRAWCAAPAQFVCPAGTTPANPQKYRTRPADSRTSWSGWQLLNGPCLTSSDPEADDLSDAVARELKTLKIPAKRAQIAPVTDWFPVQFPMTYYTDAEPERLTTTVLETDVELELTPTTFTWNPGDGTDPFTSAKPGAPFPDDTVTHVYTRVGEYRITLTTSREGRFRVAGSDTCRPITGTGSTTHTTASFETREIRSVLS
ncbi:PKD domain-containing protein [Sanguibacter sp. A247]|uniref:PKD domain-containing protein n=1 Tax=unclassified Sanguibacter TaxID=2645534 RepID=UPI003FD7981F